MEYDDVLVNIFSHINSGSAFKSVLFTCTHWNKLINQVHPNGKNIFANHLATLLKFLPDKLWNYALLSMNPNITWEIVQANPDKLWDYALLYMNPNITREIVRANPNEPWDYALLSINPEVTWEIIANSGESHEYYLLSKDPNITWEYVCTNSNKPWNFTLLSKNRFKK